ncbi:MAG: glycosyltransferase family 2 protein [Acidobacteriota bacterium]|nr:glycosyltransferase family 2 protein [Acidobacteriota bacterium]
MRVSVLVPAYNCEATLRATLDSVLAQTQPADEILVLDDGSTDGTRAIAESYKPRVTCFSQPNGGVARARNRLLARAKGELIAFVDTDDIWHPKYLESQCALCETYPNAVAFYTGHVNFSEDAACKWPDSVIEDKASVTFMLPADFLRRYNQSTGPFGSASYCAIPMAAFRRMGSEPYMESGVEDSYCASMLSLLGPVVYNPTPLVAYRIRPGSLSANHVRSFSAWVHVFELLESRFKQAASPDLMRAFRSAFAAKRRSYAKLLMGVGRFQEARSQLRRSLLNSLNPISQIKSLAMLLLTYLPPRLQPTWPSGLRGSIQGAE